MNSTNSFLYTVIDRIRLYLDDPDVNAKYTDQYIVQHTISPSLVDVISRLALTSGAPVLLPVDLTLVADQYIYELPPCVGSVLAVTTIDEDGNDVSELKPRSHFHVDGLGWSLEGHPGLFRLKLGSNSLLGLSSLRVWYVSTGDVHPHYGSGTLADVSGTDTVTLANTPTLGLLDRRPNAYAGQVLRVLPSSSAAAVEQRIITSSTFAAGVFKALVDHPFTYTSDGAVTYEIAPAGSQSLYEAIACWAAMKLGTARRITNAHYERLTQHYRAALKSSGDVLTNVQGRVPHHIERNTRDNPNGLSPAWFPLR